MTNWAQEIVKRNDDIIVVLRKGPLFFQFMFFFFLYLITRIARINLEITYGGITLTLLTSGGSKSR